MIHRLVQTVIVDNLQNVDKRRFMEMVVALFLCAFPPFEKDKLQTCRQYQAQVVGPLRAIMELDTEDVARVPLWVGHFLHVDGRYHDAEHFERRAIQICTALFGSEDLSTLECMNSLAETYHSLGRTEDAAALHEKVLHTDLEARHRASGYVGEHEQSRIDISCSRSDKRRYRPA
jgi:hypothetical protein